MKHEEAAFADSHVTSSGFTVQECLWYHAGAAMLGLALMAKGPQVAFVVLFLICYVAIRRKWRCLGQFILSGAPLTFAVLGLPWWLYVLVTRGAARWKSEIEITATGADHAGWFYNYFAYILYGVAPWCAFVVAGLVESVRRMRRDWRHLGLILWALTIFIPLCFTGDKLLHYLIPLMPPLLIIAGWLIGEVWTRQGDEGFLRAMCWLLLGSIVGCLLVVPTVLLTAQSILHDVRPFDWAMAAIVLVAGLVALAGFLTGSLRRAFGVFSICSAACMVLLVGWWMPSIDRSAWNTTKQLVEAHAVDQPVVYYARQPNLRFSFILGQVVPVIDTPAALEAWLAKKPDTVVIVLKIGHHLGLKPPPFLVERRIIRGTNEKVGIYTLAKR